MNKTFKTLSVLIMLSEVIYAQDIIKVNSYELSGMSEYLNEKDIDAITNILADKTGNIPYKQLKDNETAIQNYFDSTYNTKFKVECIVDDKKAMGGVLYTMI